MSTIPPLRRCCICGNEFPFTSEYFESKKRNKSGLGTRCHTCNRERKRQYLQTEQGKKANREKMQRYRTTPEGQEATRRARYKHYHENGGRERMMVYRREYHRVNRQIILDRQKEYNQRPEVKERRRLYLRTVRATPEGREKKRQEAHEYNHRPEVQEYRRRYYSVYWQTPQGRLIRRVSNQKRRAMLGKDITPQQIALLRDESDGRCAYCGIPVGDSFHIDHMTPVSRGGTNDLINLVIACPSCNLSKSDKTPDEWARVRGW